MKYIYFLFFALLTFCINPCVVFSQPSFPGAEGFGANSIGGRGGRIIEVTNLNDNGAGSLRAAVETAGPRIVVFRVSGIITLESSLTISNPYITIAGQTAPGDGICLKNYSIRVFSTHDVIIRYICSRFGDITGNADDAGGVTGQSEENYSWNVIIDHCSFSWSVDETFSISIFNKDVTLQWCFITESLNDSKHHKDPHGFGSILGGWMDGGVSVHHNLYAHHNSRNPKVAGSKVDLNKGILIDFKNNVVYDYGACPGYTTLQKSRCNFVANYYKYGPSTTDRSKGQIFRFYDPGPKFYLTKNYIWDYPSETADNTKAVEYGKTTEKDVLMDVPFSVPSVATDIPESAYEKVLAYGGCSLPARDAVDKRIVNDVKNGTGRIINSQNEVGGWPELKTTKHPKDTDHDGMPDNWEIDKGLNPNDNSDAGNKNLSSEGYTNIEVYINGLADNTKHRNK